jgi:predicted kinase
MPIVYFLCGLTTSGKTTFAKKLAAETGAVRLTLDERMIAKHSYTIFDDEYGPLAAQEKELMWAEALTYLAKETAVILDWSLWSKQARQEWTQRVIQAGYNYKLFFLDVPLERIQQRLAVRNLEQSTTTHHIPFEEVVRFSKIFERPSFDENLNLEIIETSV